MAKKLVEVTNSISAKLFQCEVVGKNDEVNSAVIGLSLQAIIDSGISEALSRALYLYMDKDPKDVVTIEVGPFTYGITRSNVGDAVSFNPMFELTDENKTIAELDEYADDLSVKIDLVQQIHEKIIADKKNDLLIDTIIHCCKLDTFNPMTGEWTPKIENADKGVELDTYSAPLLAAVHVASILHILAKIKKQDENVKYEVPGEGTYSINYNKGKFEIGFVPGKEFKQNIKNDRLSQKLADE